MDGPAVDGLDGGVLAVKDPGDAGVDPHLRGHGAALHHAAVFRDVAEEEGQAAGGGVGVREGTDDLRVPVLGVGDVLPQGLAGDGGDVGVQISGVGEFPHHGADAAGGVQLLHEVLPGGGQVAEVGGLLADLVEELQVQGDPGLVGDGGQVQGAVGGAAQGHVHGDGVAEGVQGHDVPGPDVPADQVHDGGAGVLGQLDPGGVGGGDGAVAGQGQAQGLAEAVHGVGGEHAGAGAAGGAAGFLPGPELVGVDEPGLVGPHSLEHLGEAGLLPVDAARQHGPAGADHGGDVQPQGGHHHAGDDLVAVGQQHEAVEAVGGGQGLHGVGDEFPGGQGVVHPPVAHDDAVADADGGDLHRGAAGGVDAGLHGLRQLVKVRVAGNDLALGADHADEGTVQLLLGESGGEEEGAVGGPVHPLGHLMAVHGKAPFKKYV